jgi:nucleotide-binding universal stress UspA family protein
LAEEIWPAIPPRRILLATDLSGRGDRALDRATELARRWDAELHVVHALEGEGLASPEYQGLPSWRRPPDTVALVEGQIRDDVRGECPRLRVHVEEGPALKVILQTIERERCDLAVVGLGRQRFLAWPPVGKTIDEMFRRSPVSVLVVKRRLQGRYAHVLVGTDFTEESRLGLEVAARLFPEAVLALMNAFELPYRSLLTDNQLSRDFGEMERATINAFAAEAKIPDEVRERLVTLIEHGPPELMLSTYVMEQAADLVVIGAYERSRLFHAVVGGMGPRIVDSVPSDVLVVRALRA